MNSYNYGLAILKCIAAFCVVYLHFGDFPFNQNFDWSVPAFMSISFYLMGGLWSNPESSALVRRLKRLVLPFLVWGVIYWIAFGVFTGTFEFRALAFQLLFGHTVCTPLYFLLLLMIFTSFTFVLAKCRPDPRNAIAILMIVACLILQYANINAEIGNRIESIIPEAKYTIGRIAELLPAALIGMLLCDKRVASTLNHHPFITLLSGLFLTLLGFIAKANLPLPNGFLYQGFPILVESTGLTVLFIASDSFLLQHQGCHAAIRRLSSLCLGVYCLHWMVGFSCLKLCGMESSHMTTVIVFFTTAACSLVLSKFSVTRQLVT